MEPNKILSAKLIDVIFDGRNKTYGAYYLRNTYPQRIKKALLVTAAVAGIAFGGAAWANSIKKHETKVRISEGVILTEITETKKPEKLPEPERQPEPEPTRTQKFTAPLIVDKEIITDPPPSITDLDSSAIGLITQKGKPEVFVVDPPQTPGDITGIIQPKEKQPGDEIATTVDVPAKFLGNWKSFLERNLNPETPVENGAPAGRYSVVVQFVVDKEGNVSDIKALTNHGYGVEEEAVRVLKRAPKWQAAIQAGYPVKAYHRQVIVFEVTE